MFECFKLNVCVVMVVLSVVGSEWRQSGLGGPTHAQGLDTDSDTKIMNMCSDDEFGTDYPFYQ